MPTRRRQQFIVGQMVWMVGTILVLALLGSLALDLVFIGSLIGLLVVVELTAPVAVTPAWRRRLRWVIGAGLLVFGYLVVTRILAILPSGVL